MESTGQEQILKLIQLFVSLLFSISKCTYNCVYAFEVFFFQIQLWLQLIIYHFYQTKQVIKRTDTCVLSRRLSRQVHGLNNRCMFALANGFAGRFISCYWVSLIGFGLCPFRELVWQMRTVLGMCRCSGTAVWPMLSPCVFLTLNFD